MLKARIEENKGGGAKRLRVPSRRSQSVAEPKQDRSGQVQLSTDSAPQGRLSPVEEESISRNIGFE